MKDPEPFNLVCLSSGLRGNRWLNTFYCFIGGLRKAMMIMFSDKGTNLRKQETALLYFYDYLEHCAGMF